MDALTQAIQIAMDAKRQADFQRNPMTEATRIQLAAHIRHLIDHDPESRAYVDNLCRDLDRPREEAIAYIINYAFKRVGILEAD